MSIIPAVVPPSAPAVRRPAASAAVVRRRRFLRRAVAVALLTVAAGAPASAMDSLLPMETLTALMVDVDQAVPNSNVDPDLAAGLDLLVTGPARTSAPTAHADSLGTTINGEGTLEVSAGAAARLAGVSNYGLLDVQGTADTLFQYPDGSSGATESVYASLVNRHQVWVNGAGSLRTGTYENNGGGWTKVYGSGTLSAGGTYKNNGGTSIDGDGTLNAGGSYHNSGGNTDVLGDGTLNAGGAYENSGGLTYFQGDGTLNAGGSYENSGGNTTLYGGTLNAGGSYENSGGDTTLAGGTLNAGGAYENSGGRTGVFGGILDAGGTYENSGGTTHVVEDGVLNSATVRIGSGSKVEIGMVGGLGGGTLNVSKSLIVDGTLNVAAAGTHGAGTLLLSPGAVLSGSGTLNTGTPWLLGAVAPGNSPGTMTFGSGIATDAATRLEIELVPTAAPVAGTDNDLIAVTGTATIGGGTVVAQRWGAGDYTPGTEYTFLSAGDLIVNQELAVISDIAGVGFASAFTAGSNGTYRLIVSRVADPLSVARTSNQRTTGAALTALGSGPLLAAFNAAATDAARGELVSDLSGELFPTLLTVQVQDAARFQDLVTAQTFGAPWSCANCGTPTADGLTGWLAGYGAGGRVNGDGNARTAETGVGGAAVGLGRCFGAVSGGGFYGYESGTVRVPGADSSVTTDTHRVGGWGRLDAGRVYARTVGQVGFGDSDSRRTFPGGASRAVFGEFDSVVSAAEAEAGLRLGGANGYLVPAVGLRYAHVDQDGFAESGGVAALAVEDSTLSALRARVGARAGATLPGVPVTGTLSAFYSRDLNASAVGDVDAAFLAGGPGFTVRGTDFARDRVDLGPGVVLGGGPVRVVADYRAGLTETSVEHAGQARLEVCY